MRLGLRAYWAFLALLAVPAGVLATDAPVRMEAVDAPRLLPPLTISLELPALELRPASFPPSGSVDLFPQSPAPMTLQQTPSVTLKNDFSTDAENRGGEQIFGSRDEAPGRSGPDPLLLDDDLGGAEKIFDGSADPLDDPAAEPAFDARQRDIRAAMTFKFATGPRSRSVLDWRRKTIDGLPAEELGGGKANVGVYRYVRDGRPRVLKILTQKTDEDFPEDYPDHPAEAQLRAGAVGAVFGAPRVLRTGTIRNGPYEDYFVEMEDEAPSGSRSREFKVALQAPDKAAWLRSLSLPGRSAVAPVARFARMIVQVLEHGVVPYDADFRVTPGGDVAWRDANFWVVDENAGFPKRRDELLRESSYLLRTFAQDPGTGRLFARELLSALKRSRRIPAAVKDAVMADWSEHDAASLASIGISGSAALRSLYDGL